MLAWCCVSDRRDSVMGGMSSRTRAVFDAVVELTEKFGYPPSVREIGEAVGLRSSGSVHHYLNVLVEQGVLSRGGEGVRCRSVVAVERRRPVEIAVAATPVVGRIAAGEPMVANETFEGVVEAPLGIAAAATRFYLRVVGDSMVEARICDGDFVLVDRERRLASGSIAVIAVAGEATVKRVYDEGPVLRLVPANALMASYTVGLDEAEYLGSVVGCFHPL